MQSHEHNQKTPFISSFESSEVTELLGVDFSVLLPRERSECVEILLEHFPPRLSFPVHRHKECEQTYLGVDGEGEVSINGRVHTLRKGSVIYIPRLTEHGIRNTGKGEMQYIVVETYPQGYLADEPTRHSHVEALRKHYGE